MRSMQRKNRWDVSYLFCEAILIEMQNYNLKNNLCRILKGNKQIKSRGVSLKEKTKMTIFTIISRLFIQSITYNHIQSKSCRLESKNSTKSISCRPLETRDYSRSQAKGGWDQQRPSCRHTTSSVPSF